MDGSSIFSWPPQCIEWDGDWESYSERIYSIYKQAFNRNNPLSFDGLLVYTRRYPVVDGKDGGFWHVIGGEDGEPDVKRCERVIWARLLIENCDKEDVLVWAEPSRHDGNVWDVVFWAKDLDYYAVLARRNGYWVLRSAYDIKYETKRKKLESAYLKYGPYNKTRTAS